MISLPNLSSLKAGSARDDWAIMDFCWIKNRSSALMSLPDAMNSVLTLFTPGFLFTELCTRRTFAVEIWRGRQNSESAPVSDMVHWWANMLSSTALKSSKETSDTVPSVPCEKTAKRKIGRRYFNSFFILRANIAKSVQENECFSNLFCLFSV